MTACFTPLAGCLLRRPLCLRSSSGRLGPLAAQSATGTLASRSRLLRFKSFSFIFKRKKQHPFGAVFFVWLRGKDLTACFAPLAGCLLRRPLCLRSSSGRLGPLAAQSATGTLASRSRLLRFKSFSFIFKRKKQHPFGAVFFVWLRGKDLTACFAPLAGCLLRRPLCLRSSLRAARTARYPKCHRHFGLPLAPSQVQVLIS